MALAVVDEQLHRIAQSGHQEVEVVVAVDVSPRRAVGELTALRCRHRRRHAGCSETSANVGVATAGSTTSNANSAVSGTDVLDAVIV